MTGKAGGPRGPGRPRTADVEDTRAKIVLAARNLFSEKGFLGTSMRSIAARAGVDPALIRHYFGDKSGLLVATMQLPFNPLELIRPMLAGGPNGLGERIVTTFLTAWDQHPEVISGLIRTTVASSDSPAAALELMRNVVLTELRAVLTGPDRDLRANLVLAQLIGIATVRYVLRVEPLASAAVPAIGHTYGPLLQSLITPDGPPPR
jgi:AcrR family transcriptional regulator